MPKKLTELDEITNVTEDSYTYVVTSGSAPASKKTKISNLPFSTGTETGTPPPLKIWVYSNFT